MIKIKSISQIILTAQFCFSLSAPAEKSEVRENSAPTASSPARLQVAYFHKAKKNQFNEKIKPAFDQAKTCKSCELIDRTPYSEATQEMDESKVAAEVQALGPEFQIIFFDWNDKASEKNKAISEALVKKSVQGNLILFAAGSPVTNEPTIALGKTIAGQVPEAVIIGEMTDRERLLPHLFYGPEMLTALKPPKEFAGQSLAAVFFASRWVSHWSKRKPQDWVSYMKLKKNKVRRLWLGLEDFFPR